MSYKHVYKRSCLTLLYNSHIPTSSFSPPHTLSPDASLLTRTPSRSPPSHSPILTGAPVAKAQLTRIYAQLPVLVSRTWPQSHTLSHTALYRQRSRVTGRRLGLRPQGRASKRAARTRTQYTSSAVRRVCSAGAQWFRHSPVAHRLASASPDRPLLNSPLPLYHFRACRRVEVGRDRHAQKAGCGG